jgi:hypothetical protein
MPDWTQHVRPRLSPLGLSPAREADVEEFSQHLEDRWRELIAGGATPDEATRLALADFRDGDALALRLAPLRQAQTPLSITPGAPGGHLLSALWQDLRYGAHTVEKPGIRGGLDRHTGIRNRRGYVDFQRDPQRAAGAISRERRGTYGVSPDP